MCGKKEKTHQTEPQTTSFIRPCGMIVIDCSNYNLQHISHQSFAEWLRARTANDPIRYLRMSYVFYWTRLDQMLFVSRPDRAIQKLETLAQPKHRPWMTWMRFLRKTKMMTYAAIKHWATLDRLWSSCRWEQKNMCPCLSRRLSLHQMTRYMIPKCSLKMFLQTPVCDLCVSMPERQNYDVQSGLLDDAVGLEEKWQCR